MQEREEENKPVMSEYGKSLLMHEDSSITLQDNTDVLKHHSNITHACSKQMKEM